MVELPFLVFANLKNQRKKPILNPTHGAVLLRNIGSPVLILGWIKISWASSKPMRALGSPVVARSFVHRTQNARYNSYTTISALSVWFRRIVALFATLSAPTRHTFNAEFRLYSIAAHETALPARRSLACRPCGLAAGPRVPPLCRTLRSLSHGDHRHGTQLWGSQPT